MRHLRLLSLALFTCTCLAGHLPAAPAPAKEKSPADVAAEAFFTLRNAKEAEPNQARFTQIINSGLAFIAHNPTHSRVGAVISSLATFDTTLNDKKTAALRGYWLSLLNYEIFRQAAPLEGDAKAAFLALGAAVAGAEMRVSPARDKLEAYRAKIDRLAEAPEGARFLAEQERGYLQMLARQSTDKAEKLANELLAHRDKKVAAMAREELNLLELAKGPLELKFTTVDGREFDVAQARGKVLYVVFWSTANEASTKELTELKAVYFDHRKKSLEILAVAHDTDRDAVLKFVKDKRIEWPVFFDGTGGKDELSRKLNVRKLPESAIFDARGVYQASGVRGNKLANAVKVMMGLK